MTRDNGHMIHMPIIRRDMNTLDVNISLPLPHRPNNTHTTIITLLTSHHNLLHTDNSDA